MLSKRRYSRYTVSLCLGAALMVTGCSEQLTKPTATPEVLPNPEVGSLSPAAENPVTPLGTAQETGSGAEQAEIGQQSPILFPGNDRVVRLPKARAPVKLEGEAVSLNFEEAPVTEVVHVILGEILQLDYVIDHPLSGEITLRTRTPMPRDQLLPTLESLLLANNALMVRDANDRYFVSASKSVSSVLPNYTSADTKGAGYAHVVVPLQYIGATEMAEILKPVATDDAFIKIDTRRNLLILAGTRNQLDGWNDIIATFDIDQLQGMSVGIFPLNNSTVADIQSALGHLLGSGGEGEAVPGLSSLIRVLPIESLNSVLVVTPRAHYLEQIRSWIDKLDFSQAAADEPKLHVYEVQNGNAGHLASLLSQIYAGSGAQAASSAPADSGVAPGLTESAAEGTGTGTTAGAAGKKSKSSGFALGDNVRVVADETNNSLLIFAPPKEYAKIEPALKKLDIIPTQVLIEASIIEVTLKDELQYGLEWHLNNGFGSGHDGEAILSLGENTAIGPKAPGFSYSITNSAGVMRAVINTLADKSLVNVISTPSILVQDSHTASIHVGDQQPIRSSQTITDGGNTSTSIQYKDTGVKLEVTPQVNAGGLVSMAISQSVTDVGNVDAATEQRAFLERNVSSQVAVRTGESVVLGGLIRDNSSNGKLGVPILQDIPVFGNLFSKTTRNERRTELLIFITPRVMRDEQDLRDISREMRSRMKGLTHFEDLPNVAPELEMSQSEPSKR
ncbi:type II secretion system secretin GspD [Marinobacterium marinum]|uniref:Type II secretion system secretin GspD n=1 Tax=Marinobacterium marinum TaxID=2756129 RepID=A0A7W1WVI4_9GAMM|nr:type II secretion system secretin GspD [Marinobacterium marinum]MBA4501003.1 type II secretion system secretin GspD [Marinobacterium marinum]